MKHLLNKMFTILVIIGMLGGCTGCADKKNDGTGYLFTCTLTGNPECLDPQYTENQNAQIVMEAIFEGLLRLDETGAILPAGAERYTVSEDGLHYEFQLRNDCYWFSAGMEEKDAKPVTSKDYVYGFQRLLSPETASPHAEEYYCIKNASSVHHGGAKPEALGISAPDGATVEFDLEYPNADFLYLLTQTCAVPCNEDFFLSTSGRYGLDDKTVLCNGAFCLTKWAYDAYGSGNFLTFRKNQMYHDAEEISPSSLQFTIMRSQKEADEDFADGNSDMILTDTYPSKYLNSKNYEVVTNCTSTWGLLCNPENDILKDAEFRKALAYSIDREACGEILNGSLQPASGLIPPSVQLSGRSYRELYADEQLSLSYSPDKAIEYFNKGLSGKPVNGINALKILLPDTFSDTQTLLFICQAFQDFSGHYIGIETVSPSEYRSRLAERDYSLALYDFKTPRNSCYACLKSFSDKAEAFGIVCENLPPLLEEISGEEALSEKVAVCGEAEKAVLEENYFIPLFYQNSYFIHTAGNTELYSRPFTHSIDFRKAKHFH